LCIPARAARLPAQAGVVLGVLVVMMMMVVMVVVGGSEYRAGEHHQ